MASQGPPAKKPRLGIRKRIQQAEQQATDAKPSQLARSLLEDWAWGKISPQYAQEKAMNALLGFQGSGPSYKDLEMLAHLGTDGKYCNNVHRDLEKRVKSFLPDLFMAPWLLLVSALNACIVFCNLDDLLAKQVSRGLERKLLG